LLHGNNMQQRTIMMWSKDSVSAAASKNDSDLDFGTSSNGFSRTRTNGGVQAQDVLFGRDKSAHHHPGNKRFRSIVQAYRETYQNATRRGEKNRITNDIIGLVRDHGGRFLRKYDETLATDTPRRVGDCCWVEVKDSAVIYEKVSHALRSAKEPKRVCCAGEKVIPQSMTPLQTTTNNGKTKFEELALLQQAFFNHFIQSQMENADDQNEDEFECSYHG
jgi:hypothetical protein